MTLDEAIKHEEKVVEEHEKIKCIKAVTLEECKCAEEHRQLAEWLKELKQLREQTTRIPYCCLDTTIIRAIPGESEE